MQLALEKSQQGAALLVSLLFLLILTIIGVSALSTSSMEARIAHNFQLNNTAFHAAESAIDSILYQADRGAAGYNSATDGLALTQQPGTSYTANFTAAQLDPANSLGSASLTATGTVALSYPQAREPCPGGGAACLVYTVVASSSVSGTGAGTTHTQVVTFNVPRNNNTP